jgi:hypothetical protein
MSQYDSNLTGVLFKNDKEGNEKRPDYKGSAEIEGVQYWVSAWIRDTAKGKCLSMKYERKEQQPQAAPKAAAPAPSAGYGAIDDDIPFAPMHYLA